MRFSPPLPAAKRRQRVRLALLFFAICLSATGMSGRIRPASAAAPAVSVSTNAKNQQQIAVSGAGATVTLRDIQQGLAALGQASLLQHQIVEGEHVWTLFASLLIEADVTLRIAGGAAGDQLGSRADWLRLFSNPGSASPYDYTKFATLKTEAYDNGNHGFIISKGCSYFIFRNNISHNNKVTPASTNPSAHGFMLDPGTPAAPSTNNLLENNIAYGNDGYGLRVKGSNDTIIRNNEFYDICSRARRLVPLG